MITDSVRVDANDSFLSNAFRRVQTTQRNSVGIAMQKFEYTPDDDSRVHKEGAIRLLCRAFQSHEDGLPEWVKNAADEYARRNTKEDRRAVVIIFRDGSEERSPSISCLDFGGMSSAVIERHFRVWADPEAALQGGTGEGVQGGHGNGGKCYMAQMFGHHSMLYSVTGGRGNRYGTAAGSFAFGYIPDRDSGRDFGVSDLAHGLDRSLADIGCSVSVLPAAARSALAAADGFTLITGVGPKGIEKRIAVDSLMDSLLEHPQMVYTLQFCEVFVIHNGALKNRGKPLSLPRIPPMPGSSTPRTIPIPLRLKDPQTGERVPTTEHADRSTEGRLVLRTSARSMRTRKKSLRHSVTFHSSSGFIGYVPVADLDIQSPYRNRIYGECILESLESYKQNDRKHLAESPLSRAVQHFVAYEIQKLATEFEIQERRKYSTAEKSEVSRINEALDKWKNRFLTENIGGTWGPGGPKRPRTPRVSWPIGHARRIDLALSHTRMGRGVDVTAQLKFYDANGGRVRAVPVRWITDDPNIAMVNEDLGTVTSFSYGATTVYAETLDGGLRSNRLALEVVKIHSMKIEPATIEVPLGSRRRLSAICTLEDGAEADDVSLEWTENDPKVAISTATGMVVGLTMGTTEITAEDDSIRSGNPAAVVVTEGDGEGEGDKSGGRGFPRVLVSGDFDHDPVTGKFTQFSDEDPPIMQRPADVEKNIWWINSAAPLAELYLDKGQGYGYGSREWRVYHVEKYVEIIAQIITRDEVGEESMTIDQWMLNQGHQIAAIQLHVVSDLSEFIASGELPMEG